jgi:hypothetical protein
VFNLQPGIAGSMTLAADSAFPVDVLPTTLPDGSTQIAGWQANWGNGNGPVPFDPNAPASWPQSNSELFHVAFTALDASGNPIYYYPATNIQFVEPAGTPTGGPDAEVTGENFSATANQLFTGEVARFTSSVSAAIIGADYAATILWGDGDSSAGVISYDGGSLYSVSGTHTYLVPDVAPVLIEIDDGSGDPATGLGTAMIADSLTLAVPASATLESDGTTVDLYAVGDDAAGADQLTYSWTVTGGGGAAVTFCDNDDNEAQSTFATLSAAGTYEFTVSISNPSGQSVTSNDSVIVSQVATDVDVTAPSSTVVAGSSIQLTAGELDQFGLPMNTQPGFDWVSPAEPPTGIQSGLLSPPESVAGQQLPVYAYAEDANGNETGLVGSCQIEITDDVQFAATNATASTISLTVPASYEIGSGNEIETEIPNGNFGAIFPYESTAANTYTVSGLASGTLYSFRVQLFDWSNDTVSYSPVVSASTTSQSGASNYHPPSIPLSPQGYAAMFEQDGVPSVRLMWPDVSSNETGFSIERSLDGGATYEPLATVSADTGSYIDSDPPAGDNLEHP